MQLDRLLPVTPVYVVVGVTLIYGDDDDDDDDVLDLTCTAALMSVAGRWAVCSFTSETQRWAGQAPVTPHQR